MEGNLSAVYESLFQQGGVSEDDRRNLFLVDHTTGCDSFKNGLHELLLVLTVALSPGSASPKMSNQFSGVQVGSLVSLGFSIVSALRSLPPEQVEPVAVAVVQRLLDFALCYLESSECDEDDNTLQNQALSLLELAWNDGADKTLVCGTCSLERLQEIWLMMCSESNKMEVDPNGTWDLQGLDNVKPEKSVDRIVMSFASELVQFEKQEDFCGPFEKQEDFVTLCQRWGVFNLDCIRRLLKCSWKMIVGNDSSDQKTIGPKILSFSLRTFQLLKRITEKLPWIDYDMPLLQEIAKCTDMIIFIGNGIESYRDSAAVDGNFESLHLRLIEEFICMIRYICRGSNLLQNVQACIVSSMIDNLGFLLEKYEKDATNLRGLVHLPRATIFIVKLIKELRKQTSRAVNMHLASEHGSSVSDYNIFCCVHGEKIDLLDIHSDEKLIEIIFASSTNWLQDFIHVLQYLHEEGKKSAIGERVEKSQPVVSKQVISFHSESNVPADDEALFGDLFSEGNRPALLSDDQVVSVDSCPSSINMAMEAANELLVFLKDCVFSNEWSSYLFSYACQRFQEKNIDVLLSLLKFDFCLDSRFVEDRGSSNDGKKIISIQGICCDLMHNLLVHRVLTDSQEEYLVEEIINIEKGNIVYNKLALCLVAYAVASRLGSTGSQLRTRLYKNIVDWVSIKALASCSQLVSVKELMSTLPAAFHVEILLMAFHLSSEAEKVGLASLVFEALKSVNIPSENVTMSQFSCWALVIATLIILLRHMLAYAQICPSPLLISLKSKWREVSYSSLIEPNIGNDQTFSWVFVAMKNLSEPLLEEEPVLRSLVGRILEDFALPLLTTNELAFEFLQLNPNDVIASFSNLLGLWKGRKSLDVEDLLVERYFFSLCSDFNTSSSLGFRLFLKALHACELSDTSFFVLLGSFFSDNKIDMKGSHLLELSIEALQHLCKLDFYGNFEELGWDFLRNGVWFSFILSLFNVGLNMYCDSSDASTSLNWIEKSANDTSLALFAESLTSSLIETADILMLLRLLSTLLRTYLRVYRKAYLATVTSSSGDVHAVTFLILKHNSFDKSEQDELMIRSGVCAKQLKSVLGLFSKLKALVDRGTPGIFSQLSRELLLHGFPTHQKTSSSVLLSCIVCVKGCISVLAKFCGAEGWRRNIDPVVAQDILELTMAIKFDIVFQPLYGDCDTIITNLSGENKCANNENIYLLMQIGELLSDFSETESRDSRVLECLILKIIDTAIFLKQISLNPNGAEVNGEGKNALGSYCSRESNLVLLLSSLDHYYCEAINVKVLSFFVDLVSETPSSSLLSNIEKKFLSMDIHNLSKWLKFRLLGSLEPESGIQSAKACSLTLRETTNNFISSVMSIPSNHQSELQERFFEALLMLLDDAFLEFDIYVAMSYFHFVVQHASRLPLIRLLLNKILHLINKLSSDERWIPGLKILFDFLGNIVSDRGTIKYSSGKSIPGTGVGSGAASSMSVGSRRNSEAPFLATGQEPGSTHECDLTSPDEDEDDGTSDGEVASMDKEEEEESNNEKSLASKVCSFTSSGSNFMEQHWYFCYTCDLTVSKGCCSVCAKVCHSGHRVVYSRSSRFFCDCGAGGVRGSSCQCLKPRKYSGTDKGLGQFPNTAHSLIPFSEESDHIPESDSDVDEEVICDADNSLSVDLFRDLQDQVYSLVEELDVESQVLQFCSSLLPSIISRRDAKLSQDKMVILNEDKVLNYDIELFHLKKAYKGGSFDLKFKTDYSNAKELRTHLASGSLVKSLLSVSKRGRLAVGEGDKIVIYDVGQLIGQATIAPVTADKNNVKAVSKNIVRFEIVHLTFNAAAEKYLAVAGFEDCQVLTLNPRGEVIDRLAIELVLQGGYIRRIEWVPGSQVKLLVVTNKFIKIYDLSQDNVSPIHYFTLPHNMIVDAAILTASRGRMFLIVLSDSGSLFRLELTIEGAVGITSLKDAILLDFKGTNAKGSSLYFSASLKILFVSFEDGTTLMCRLNSDMTSIIDSSSINDEQDGKLKSASLHRWRELFVGSGMFACISGTKPISAHVVLVQSHVLHAQNTRCTLNSSSHLVGLTSYKPLSKDKLHCLSLYDDGSLQIYSHLPAGTDTSANMTAEKVKKLGSGILNSKVFGGAKPEFPIDYFEKTVCITCDVKLGGDAIRNGDSEVAKQSLTSEDGFLESPTPSGFKVSVSNSNPDIVMVGMRIHVGNTSASHIPSEITIFHRTIKLDEGMRSWYDFPFTVAECLLADEEFTISVGPTLNGTALPRIDSLEVYGRAKDEFGWKERLDALLNMESRALGVKSLVGVSDKKGRLRHTSIVQEQVFSNGLTFLSSLYAMRRLQNENMKVDPLSKCRALLETIFESDRERFLQAAACRVLHAAFPNKDIYYQVKDNMRLHGVLKSTSCLLSKVRVGGTTSSSIVDEFTAQIRAVSKIALHRRSNFSEFLEMNGAEVIDGLMHVLWEILDVESPDTQTMNNIVISSVELIYCYAECLAFHGKDIAAHSVAPAVLLFKKLLFHPNKAVQSSSSLAIASRLLQMPFPKQTLLTSDDHTESLVPPLGTEVTTAGNTQVLIEEDSTTSSVQYCCDGCSTVPILRRRWHCTVCPDFDLCEACYRVLDSDRLPPHSRDHPMTAISIEMELIGDSNHNQFPTGDGNSSTVLPSASDAFEKSLSHIHVLEPSHSGGFTSSIPDNVSISASKKAVNSCILLELLKQLDGWMMTTSGNHAIPVMQLFYRLSSAAGGPFVNSPLPETLSLEKLVRWFLDEMNLSNPFVAKSRSSFGEVIILVFIFFTLMLRNWHQPSSDSTLSKFTLGSDSQDKTAIQISSDSQPSTVTRENDTMVQLPSACNLLRNQTFIDFLMDILQQLMNFFKSPVAKFDASFGSSPSSGCGALLSVRRDMPSGIYSPFFSDTYAKAHQTDMFVDYHRLLLENTFRLVYSLVRPEKHEKNLDKEKIYRSSSFKDWKLDNYHDVLCSYINNPSTNFVRRYARRLFLYICGSKTQYYIIRDAWQFSNEVKKLHKHIIKSGVHQNVISYERNVKIVKCLSTMAEVASSRPRNWQKFCVKNGDVLPFLMDGVFYFCEESVIPTLKLLNLVFYTGKDLFHSMQKMEIPDSSNISKQASQSNDLKKKKKNEDVLDDKFILEMEAMVEVFNDKDGVCLKQFIECFLLEWNSSSVRTEAKCALYGAWFHGKDSFKEIMLSCLLQRVKSLPMYGQNIIEFTELVAWLLGTAHTENDCKQLHTALVDRCLTPEILNSIFDTLHSQNELVANHPNSRIYNTLSGLVEFDGYYLESEPCVACSSPEVPYSKMKLESLKSETKFTDNRIIVKCTGSYTIQTVIMNVHDARKSKSVKVLNLYYNNRPVADLSELKNNWSLWKRAKTCHLSFNQSELKVEFPIPITACNFMIELDSFYENLQALSLEPLQCPRCSRPVTDKHGICGNCHENAYQCRQCRNINYENLDSFLCNECGYSKYGRFEFNFMAKPSFTFDEMENDGDMKRGLSAIESESENAHRRYQQLLGFKKPLLKLVSSIGETEIDSQQKDSVQQMMASLPGPSCKINRKIALLGVLYGEKCKAAFDSVSKSVQTLQGLRRVLMSYLHQKHSEHTGTSRLVVSRSPNNCFGCATTFVTQCLKILQLLSTRPVAKKHLVSAGILSELFENNIHQGPRSAHLQARAALCAFSEGDIGAVTELNNLVQKKVMYCLEHHRSMDIALATREELLLLSEFCSVADEFWESRLRVVFQLLFSSIKSGSKHPSIAEQIILPCLRIISQACTSPKPDAVEKNPSTGKSDSADQVKEDKSLDDGVSGIKNTPESSDKTWDVSKRADDMQLLSYSEWEKGASYIDFVRRQYKVAQSTKSDLRSRPLRNDYLALKYMLRWKRNLSKGKSDLSVFEVGSWVTELILSACSQSIRSEMCMLISLLCAESSSRKFRLMNLLLALLPATLSSGESAAEYFDLIFKMIESEDARLFLTVRGCLQTICKLITQEVSNVESLERSVHIDISQGFILHKLVELLGKFLEVPNIRTKFMQDNLLSAILEALIVIRGLIVQKTKLISDCNRLLQDLLEGLLIESAENKRLFIRACICGLQNHAEERRGRSCLFILEQLCNLICPSKPESIYLLILNKAHTQEEFIRGSMTKNPYSSSEIGPLMRDVKNKICNQLELFGLLEDDYGMELLVAGNIISLDLSVVQVYEHVWRKSNNQSSLGSNVLSSNARDCSPMTVTYRLQGLDGEATEPMIKEIEEDREESQDPEVEFAIASAVRDFGGLEILLSMIQRFREDFKSNQERLEAVLNVLMLCCKIKENRRALLKLGALALLLETARRAFSVEAMEPAEGILLIVESLSLEANESDSISIAQSSLTVSNEEAATSEQAKKIVLMFLERLSHPSSLKKSSKQQRNTEMVARILPYLTYGEPSAMDALILHFESHLKNWKSFDDLQLQHQANPKDESIALSAAKQKFSVENFVRVSESLKTSSCGERLKDIMLEKGIPDFAVKHLSESFAIIDQPNFKSSPEWSSCLKLPSVPHILSMLRGLSMGHLLTQKCIDDGAILPLLHALEGVTGENEIGARAENLLDTLADKEGKGDGFLGEKVWTLRRATRDEMRRRALKKREELLQGLGMKQEVKSDGGEMIVVAKTVIEGLDDVEEEEDGLACMVCREGYTLRPSDLLGVYSYSKRVNLGVGNVRGESVFTTVSYFNIIHFQCHQEAKRGDAALKNPKKEWEGATLRNNESLCNSLFPVRGPLVPLAQYVRHVDQYWDNLNALGRSDGSRLRLLIYDIVLMLARFATGASFSSESRGGGRESNSRFLPFMIQMGRYLIDQGSPSQKQQVAAQGSEETVQFAMVNALLTESYEQWVQQRRGFLQRGLHHAYMQHTHRRPSGRAVVSGDDVLPAVRPMLVYTGLVEQLQLFIKGRKPVEDWKAAMKERLLNFKEMAGFSNDLLTWLDEINSATCMMEAFDVMGMLGDALSEGVSSCEDFVLNAIQSV